MCRAANARVESEGGESQRSPSRAQENNARSSQTLGRVWSACKSAGGPPFRLEGVRISIVFLRPKMRTAARRSPSPPQPRASLKPIPSAAKPKQVLHCIADASATSPIALRRATAAIETEKENGRDATASLSGEPQMGSIDDGTFSRRFPQPPDLFGDDWFTSRIPEAQRRIRSPLPLCPRARGLRPRRGGPWADGQAHARLRGGRLHVDARAVTSSTDARTNWSQFSTRAA